MKLTRLFLNVQNSIILTSFAMMFASSHLMSHKYFQLLLMRLSGHHHWMSLCTCSSCSILTTHVTIIVSCGTAFFCCHTVFERSGAATNNSRRTECSSTREKSFSEAPVPLWEQPNFVAAKAVWSKALRSRLLASASSTLRFSAPFRALL